jgi:hypothetical protein
MARESNAAQSGTDAGSIRNAVRWGLLLAAVGTVGFRLPRLLSEFRQWRAALGMGDGSDAQSWHTVLEVDLAASLVVVLFGVGAFYLLRPRVKAAE